MRLRGLVALTAIVLTAAMAGTAQADFLGHERSFDGSGSTGGAFVKPNSVGVNFAADSVVVVDPGKPSSPVEQFDLEGNPKAFASKAGSNSLGALEVGGERDEVAIDNSGTASDGNIYVASQQPGRLYGFNAAGEPLGGNWPLQLEGACGVSVDSAGHIWAANGAANEYTPDGVPTGVALGGPACHNHWNSVGWFYSQGGFGFGGATIRIFKTFGEYPKIEDLQAAQIDDGFDIDLTTDDVYINQAKYVVVLNQASETIERFGEKEDFGSGYPGMQNSLGLAVDPATKKVYLADAGATPPRVEIFAPHPPLPPVVSEGVIKQVRSSNAVIAATINPGGGETEYSIEYGLTDKYGSTGLPSPAVPVAGRKTVPVTVNLQGLAPGSEYHYRVVAKNSTTTAFGPDRTLITYAPTPGDDKCENQLVRKQTGASGLADCRAYELASAADTGGYNVSSDLVQGETPLPGFPAATSPSKLLYTLESGSIPGSGVPTSFPDDPYVATRGENGWTTKYVGIPADGTNSSSPFASAFTDADVRLNTFAFAGPDLCSPCFGDGKTGIPVRRPDGSIVQGMAGSSDPGPGAQAKILVRKRLSTDGSHLIFGSTEPFEADAPPSGQPAIYSRDLDSGTTSPVSKDKDGANIACLSDCATDGVAELDLSADGSRVVIGQRVGEGPSGASLWHPYVNVDGASSSIDLAPTSTDGVLFYGITEDGSKAFFSSDQRLTPDDHDDSVDVFRADISATGATLTRISKGSDDSGDTDSCDPVADADHEHWNSLGSSANCDVVPVGGGGGLGRTDGSFYFVSPEQLDGPAGVADAPNLYLAKPDGDLAFVATLDSDLNVAEELTYQRRQVLGIPGFTAPGQMAVDKDSKYLYVADSATDTVSRFDQAGNPAPFSFAAPYVSGNKLTGTPERGFGLTPHSQLAIDESSGPAAGYLYVADTEGTGTVVAFKQSGEYVGGLPGPNGACGIGVSPSGVIYDITGGLGFRYKATTATPETYAQEGGFSFGYFGSCAAASDSTNSLYVQASESGPIRKLKDQNWEAGNPFTTLAEHATGLAGKSGGGGYLIDHGTSFDEFDADGTLTVGGIGSGFLVDSLGVAGTAGGNVYASDQGTQSVRVYGPPEIKYLPEISSSPIVVHGLEQPDVADSADFQVEPSGGSAAFISSMPLTAAVVGQKRQVFRYDGGSGDLDCASCNPTGVQPVDGGRLSAFGSSMASNGRVFFNSAEPLVLRDANGKVDVYQWSKADGVQLVSPGNSQFDNTLLSVSRDGTDAYFFSRNSLVPQAGNGELMKIYDARAGGGFLVPAARVPCAASDECHGAGSEPPAPLIVNTVGDKTGKGANFKPGPKKCGKGKVRKKGKCVKKKAHKKKAHKKGKRGAGQ